MVAPDTAPKPVSPPRYVLSVEITPAEFDYYMKKAQQMRAESMASIFTGLFAAVRRLFARAKPAPRAPQPVLVKSRTA